MYDQRNKVLNCSVVDIDKIIKGIINKYSSFLVEEYGIENIKSYVGHLINVDECYSPTKNIFKENLRNELTRKYNNVILHIIQSKNVHESYVFVQNLQRKILNIMDVYWIEHINLLDSLRSSSSVGVVDDPFKRFEYVANDRFAKELIPSIYNEVLTYALNPNLKLGEYSIKESKNALLENKIMI